MVLVSCLGDLKGLRGRQKGKEEEERRGGEKGKGKEKAGKWGNVGEFDSVTWGMHGELAHP